MKMRIVYKAPASERKALYKGNRVALMVVTTTKMRWINPTQEQVDKMTEKYQVFVEAGGRNAYTIQLRKKD